MDPFVIREPKAAPVPFILSVPHCGTAFPEELQDLYVPGKVKAPDDTDWFVHELYDFALEKGITMIHARYSRWVIDLNRDPESKPLYNDGRIITALTPTTDFFGDAIYKSPEFEPDQQETQRRIAQYYQPYYDRLKSLLDERLNKFGKVLLWDAHSIRRSVPTIQKDSFPDMILGNNDETTAAANIIGTALTGLRTGPFQVNHNSPFKGGNITRSFGEPGKNIHALQLEMNKILYMDDEEKVYSPERATVIRELLSHTFDLLIDQLKK